MTTRSLSPARTHGPAALVLALLLALALPAVAQDPATEAAADALPQRLDADRDGFYDPLETALGSDPRDRNSSPESHALADADGNGVADACEDFLDNDGDGKIDAADPGCRREDLTVDLGPGVDVFTSVLELGPGSLGTGLPPQALTLRGATVIRRGEEKGGVLAVEMVAQQLAGRLGERTLTLVEDPGRASGGEVASEDAAPPWRSRFDVHALAVLGGEVVPLPPIEVTNPGIPTLPPVQDERKIDKERCYEFPGGLHCPTVPVLRIPVLKYVAKFDCGEQPSSPPPFLGPVKPGDYATKIVVHNPHGVPVQAKKKVSVGRRNPETGPISKLESFKLPPNGTTDVDCPDILRLLHEQVADGVPLPFSNGVVEILSQKKLDVIANYTYELPKEKIEFKICPPEGAPTEMFRLAGKRLKVVTLTRQDQLIVEEEEVRRALARDFPAEVVARTQIEILGDELGVGAGLEVEAIQPQRCVLIDPPDLPEGRLECAAPRG